MCTILQFSSAGDFWYEEPAEPFGLSSMIFVFFAPPSLPSLERLRQINTPERNQESSSVTLYKQPSASCKMFLVSVYFCAWLSLSEKYSRTCTNLHRLEPCHQYIFILYADTLFFLKNEKLRIVNLFLFEYSSRCRERKCRQLVFFAGATCSCHDVIISIGGICATHLKGWGGRREGASGWDFNQVTWDGSRRGGGRGRGNKNKKGAKKKQISK